MDEATLGRDDIPLVPTGDPPQILEAPQPTVSHHLKVLTAAGFLTRSKRGTWAYYTLVPGALDRVSRFFSVA